MKSLGRWYDASLSDKSQVEELRQGCQVSLNCGVCSLVYCLGIVELPISSLTEELKCAKVRLEMTLTQSKDPVVRRVAPTVNAGRKWKPKQAVQQAQSALRHRDKEENGSGGNT